MAKDPYEAMAERFSAGFKDRSGDYTKPDPPKPKIDITKGNLVGGMNMSKPQGRHAQSIASKKRRRDAAELRKAAIEKGRAGRKGKYNKGGGGTRRVGPGDLGNKGGTAKNRPRGNTGGKGER
jgi:hypothetical protein